MRRTAGILLVLLGALRADEAPSWEPFTVLSENSRAQAEVKANSKGGYTLAVKTRTGRKWTTQWKSVYAYDGYPGGLVANSGKHFVYYNEWWSKDGPVLMVYTLGKKREYPGRLFVDREESLETTASHRLWLSQSQRPRILVRNGRDILALTTIDNRVLETDLKGTLPPRKIP